MKRWNELTTPEQHLAMTGEQIDYWYVTSFWMSDESAFAGSERYGDYDTLAEALEGLAKANELDGITTQSDSTTAAQRLTTAARHLADCDAPISWLSLLAMSETEWHVQLHTIISCTCVCGDTVAVLPSRDAALSYIAAEYGVTRQGLDGDTGFDRWWLA